MINKFRVWDPETQKMWYAHNFKNDDNQFMMNMNGDLYAWLNLAYTLSEPFRKVDCVPMRYIGLKDMDGKKIYDGDILEFDEKEWGVGPVEDRRWPVFWNVEEAAWDTGGGITRECSISKTVVGNIYEGMKG